MEGIHTMRSMISKKFHEKHRSLGKDEKAMMSPILGILATFMGILVFINLFPTILAPIMSQSDTQLSTYNDSNATAAYTNIKAASWGSISLSGNIPIVVIAFLFIYILGGSV